MTDPKEKLTNGKKFLTEEEIMEAMIDEVDAMDDSPSSESGHHHAAASEYFDTTTLSQRAGACPITFCKAALPPRIGKRMPMCPVHKINVHSKTFVYNDPLRNIRFERDYFERDIWKNEHKSETHRFGYENSEDALTWNVFASLARQRRLSALSRCFSRFGTSDEPELYLWGLRVSLDGPAPHKQFDALYSARKVFESGITRMHTEPDIMLYAPNRFLILVEAKFMSPNTTVRPGATEELGEKPKTREGILRRYSADQLPPGSLLAPTKETPLFSQLYRNLVFAIHMAAQLNVQWGFVNLTRKRAYKSMSDDVTAFSNAVLPPESQHRFLRYSWEQLFRDHVEGQEGLDELATYMRHKSANCVRAFDI